ncbi:MAG: DUF4214 domain-containing protein [Clostridiales bacterium]|nr:DUF4214 domain-containing protein [Clostridiales bacterium]
MKVSIFAKTFGFVLAASITASVIGLPAEKVSATSNDKDEDITFSLEDEAEHTAGKLIVSTKNSDLNSYADALEDAALSIRKIDVSFNDHLYAVEYDSSLSAEEIMEAYEQIPDLEYCQYEYIYTLDLPEDNANKGETKGYQVAQIRAVDAWDYLATVTYSKVRVAVVDQGVDYTHPDLEGFMNLDLCWDAYYEEPLSSKGINSHGTHVAGIITAKNSGASDTVRGVAAGHNNDIVELMSVNVFPSGQGSTPSEPIIRGVDYATTHGAQVINLSLGGSGYDLAYHQAIATAYENNITVVCAAGNDNSKSFHRPSDFPESISVIALDYFTETATNPKASYSNYGAEKDVAAPGTSVYSTVPGGSYGTKSGTSMACPAASAVAAMIRAVNPALNPTEVKNIMQFTSIDLNVPGFDEYTAYGEIDAGMAVKTAAVTAPGMGRNGVESFVWRLYDIVMDRLPDDSGIAYWSASLKEGNTGADVVRFFCLSEEFKAKDMYLGQLISLLYRAIFNRLPDQNGFDYWTSCAYNFNTYEEYLTFVVNGFIDSPEWCNLCASYGIRSGAPTAKATIPSAGAQSFATRLYTCCLGRDPEADGLGYWALALTNLETSGYDAAYFFFTSAEFVGFNTTNEEFLTRLYKTYMDREPEADGFAYWLGQLNAGATRETIILAFACAPEFAAICAQYGIWTGR